MFHLSLLTLPRSAPRWRLLDPYGLHQVLWKAFPELKKELNVLPSDLDRERLMQEKRFLYRYDEGEDQKRGEYLSVLVQSVVEPDWTFLDNESEGTTARVRVFDLSKIEQGVRLRFFLRANPVASRKAYDDRYSRRVVIGAQRDYIAEKLKVDKDQLPSRETMLLEWLEQKGIAYEKNERPTGFEVVRDGKDEVQCTIGPNWDYVMRRTGADRRAKPLTFTGIDFEGILRITDPAAFADTVRRGIGRGKSFGFGLLSLRRV
jgi:CRISPR system Cascade subunit CasE